MNSYLKLCSWLGILTIILIGLSLMVGSANLDWNEIFNSNSSDSVIFQFRLKNTLAASFVGIALPVSGMLLQEYFKNVLAGPSIMGISASAGLGIALLIFLGIPSFFFQNEWLSSMSFVLAGLLGALVCLAILLSVSKILYNSANFIIIGFLISALASASIGVLQVYSSNSDLKQYVIWSFGTFSGLSWTQILLFLSVLLLGASIGWKSLYALQGNILGELYAQSVGVNLHSMKVLILVSTSLLVGVTTAMVGPIAFIGIIVPFFSRLLISEAHLYQQFFINILLGISVLVFLNMMTHFTKLPINILTSFLGIPLIAYIVLLSNRKV